MQVWNRKELIEVPEVGLGAIRFTYNTAFGRILAKGILCRKFVSNIYDQKCLSPFPLRGHRSRRSKNRPSMGYSQNDA